MATAEPLPWSRRPSPLPTRRLATEGMSASATPLTVREYASSSSSPAVSFRCGRSTTAMALEDPAADLDARSAGRLVALRPARAAGCEGHPRATAGGAPGDVLL